MRKVGYDYRCALCNARLAVPEGAEPRISIEGASGKPNTRVLTLDGREVHRCVLPKRSSSR